MLSLNRVILRDNKLASRRLLGELRMDMEGSDPPTTEEIDQPKPSGHQKPTSRGKPPHQKKIIIGGIALVVVLATICISWSDRSYSVTDQIESSCKEQFPNDSYAAQSCQLQLLVEYREKIQQRKMDAARRAVP